MTDAATPRAIRSFVVRSGRLTPAQRRALEELWPRYGIEFVPRPLDLDALFGRRAPRVLEIGFGNGMHLAALAAERPQCDFLGIEVHPPGIGHLLRQLAQADLANVRILGHDAIDVIETQIPKNSIAEVHILFPDPWPKKRHHKRRLIRPSFAASLAERLAPGAVLKLATDWSSYAQHMLEVLEACPALENLAPDGRFIDAATDRPPTRFEQRGERLGHAIWELAYRRR